MTAPAVLLYGAIVLVTAVLITAIIAHPPRLPAAEVAAGIAARNAEIVRLHREIGIDPIFDPLPEFTSTPVSGKPPRAPIGTQGRVAGMELEFARMQAENAGSSALFVERPGQDPIPPLRLRLCPECGLPVAGAEDWTSEVLARHLRDEHGNG